MLLHDSEPPAEGWHKHRFFWPAFLAVFLVAFVWCLFPADDQHAAPAPPARHAAPPRDTIAPPADVALTQLPIPDTAPPLAWLQGEIVVETPIRTALRPEPSPEAASSQRR